MPDHYVTNLNHDLNILLLTSDFDLIFVTETWLHSDINDSLLLSNSSYSLIRKDRPDKFGGVAIYLLSTA